MSDEYNMTTVSQMFGITGALLDKLDQKGASLVVGTSVVKLTVLKVAAGIYEVPVSMKPSAVKHAVDGILSPGSLVMLRVVVEEAMMALSKKLWPTQQTAVPEILVAQNMDDEDQAMQDEESGDDGGDEGSEDDGGLDELFATLEEDKVAVVDKVVVESVESGSWVIQPPIKLSNSKKVGQLVRGTSQGSVYVTIAVGADLRVAARVRPDMAVSIRVEGEVGKYKSALQAGGFSVGADHASAHLNAGTKVMMRKTVGALLHSIGAVFTETLTNFDPLIGVGSS